jgi:hypothetical protein
MVAAIAELTDLQMDVHECSGMQGDGGRTLIVLRTNFQSF